MRYGKAVPRHRALFCSLSGGTIVRWLIWRQSPRKGGNLDEMAYLSSAFNAGVMVEVPVFQGEL